jgi:hypothetical protein
MPNLFGFPLGNSFIVGPQVKHQIIGVGDVSAGGCPGDDREFVETWINRGQATC